MLPPNRHPYPFLVRGACQGVRGRQGWDKRCRVAPLLAVSVAALLAISGGCAPVCRTCIAARTAATHTPDPALQPFRVVDLVNQERSSRGLSPLHVNASLGQVAAAHAADMRRSQSFSHAGSDGSSIDVRVNRAGYGWARVGENLALGQDSAEAAVRAWMDSPGHRANILNPAFQDVGVAVDLNGAPIWVQVFGRPL